MRIFLVGVGIVAVCGCGNPEASRPVKDPPPAREPAAPTVAEPALDEPPSTPVSAPAAADSASHPAGYWPVWRGPYADGISPETGWFANWPKGGPPILWRAELGIGFSSFTIADGRLFTMGRIGDQDAVYCLNPDNGETIWKHTYACSLVDNLHEGGPGATPTIDGDRVYTLSRDGHLFCFAAASGDVLWKLELQKELGVGRPEWGLTCSPLIVDEKLILEVGRVVAFDKRSGKRLWQTKTDPAGYGSPMVFTHGDRRLIAVLTNRRLLVVTLDGGEEVAEFPWTTSYDTSSITPIVVRDKIFISTGYQRGCALLRLDGGRLEKIYEHKQMCNHMNNCVLWNGFLYGFDGNSHNPRTVKLACMDFESGLIKWSERGFGCGSLLISDGKLVVLSDTGELVIAEASPERLQILARKEVLDGRCWTVPLLAGQRIYCRDAAGNAACVDLRGK